MTILLIIKEIIHRKYNFLLGMLSIIIAVAFFVFFFTTSPLNPRYGIQFTDNPSKNRNGWILDHRIFRGYNARGIRSSFYGI